MGTKSKIRWSISIVGILTVVFLGASLAVPVKKSELKRTQSQRIETVWITKPDGAQSCAPESGMSLTQGAEELRKAKVTVFDSKKGTDGQMHIQMCGAESGSTNLFLISRENLGVAISLGYQEMKTH